MSKMTRSELINNPNEVLGISKDIAITVKCNTADTYYMVMPDAPGFSDVNLADIQAAGQLEQGLAWGFNIFGLGPVFLLNKGKLNDPDFLALFYS